MPRVVGARCANTDWRWRAVQRSLADARGARRALATFWAASYGCVDDVRKQTERHVDRLIDRQKERDR